MIDLVNLPSSFIKNLSYFNEQLMIEWGLSSRNHLPLSIFMIEIDKFASFSKVYGQDKVDDYVQSLACVLQNILRRESDFISQESPSKLIFLSTDMNFNQASQFAAKCHAAVATLPAPNESETTPNNVTISIGHASCVPESKSCEGPQAFYNSTKKYLLRAINSGGNCSKSSLKFK
ncbi:MAG: diguanylate cyclase [Piscirickettsiaceae bacterium]|nr:diguanylate cyclase [Piscirickettsiaceae bacterium]